MSALIDLTGLRFGRWLVLSRGPNQCHHTRWWCRCDCGKEALVLAQNLRSGHSQQCLECSAKYGGRYKHGYAGNAGRKGSPTYRSWESMIQRCTNPHATGYERWGGRGITVCKRWRKFENFLADMGPRPKGKSLDRRNNAGNYTPKNCRWATAKEQRVNQGV